MPKRHCTSRAEWRLQPGKPAEPLSAHYRLDCDYGTPVITCWADGGSEPIYLCESHAKQPGHSRTSCPDVRIITAQSDHRDSPIKDQDRIQIQQVVDPKPNGSGSSADACAIVETKVAAAVAEPCVRSAVRDLTFGDSAKAIVDEAIWNMATGSYQIYRTALQEGQSATEAAQAAGGQLAVVHRRIGDYSLKLEAVLSKSKAMINVEESIDKPLEMATLEIINNGTMSDLEKDAAIQQLGALQEWVKQGVQRNMAPLQANRIMLASGDRLNWGGTSDLPEEVRAVCRTLYLNLKTAIRTADSEAQNLHDRLTNLYAAKSDLEIC